MRVGIDATCWSNQRGYGRFTRGLVSALLQANTQHEFYLFVDAHTHGQHPLPERAKTIVVTTQQAPTQAASASGRRSLRDVWAMTRAVSRQALEAFFFPSVYTYFPVFSRARLILGVHDVIAEDYPDLIFPGGRGRQMWTLKSQLAHRQAHYILTVSEHAKRGVVRHFKHPPHRVWVVGEAADPTFRPLAPNAIDVSLLARHGLSTSDRFLVYLGGINPHKNLVPLVASLAHLRHEAQFADVRLVIIGDTQAEVFTPGLGALRQRIAELGLSQVVHFTGYIADAEAVHFLNTAQVAVLPSMAEGFGLPAVEAAACGTPVVATCNSPLPDLLAGGGFFIDPAQPEQLTEALARILSDEAGRRRMGQTALKMAQRLTWQESARQMEALLKVVEEERR